MPDDYRAEFDIPRDRCYLNAAYMTPQPRRVLEAARHGAERRAQPWQLTAPDFFSDVEALRASFAGIIRCSPDNVAIVPSASYGVACAANNLPMSGNSLILALADQFPSNYYAWRRRALASGAEYYVVRPDTGQTWTDAVLQAVERLGNRISIATLEGHHWASGMTIDLTRVVPALRDAGARVVADLTQTVGACPIDIATLAPDFVVVAGYKWLFCPYGVSFLYVAEQYLDGVPIEEGWMNRDGAEDFSRLSEFTDRYQSGARRYDVSAKSSMSNIGGALAALQMIAEWGVETIASTLSSTNVRIAGMLQQYGFDVPPASERAPHFQGARLPQTDPRQLASRLLDRGVYASVRGDRLRIAPHLYTDAEDLARLAAALEAGA